MASKRLIITALMALLLIGGIVALSLPTATPHVTPKSTVTVEIRDEIFELKLANTTPLRSRGLGGVASIPRDGGMLFVFPYPDILSFWMKDCLTAIDVAFLDTQGRITALHEMPTEPLQRPGESEREYERRLPSYISMTPAQFAIELQPGSIKRLSLQVGEKIELDLDALKAGVR